MVCVGGESCHTHALDQRHAERSEDLLVGVLRPEDVVELRSLARQLGVALQRHLRREQQRLLAVLAALAAAPARHDADEVLTP
eukprot:COSAG01_NODE_2857_length_6960_cov_44.361901_8_plen_83_part_00